MAVPSVSVNFRGSFLHKTAPTEHERRTENDISPTLECYIFDGWHNISIYKSGFIELIATMSLCYVSALVYTSISSFEIGQNAAYNGITNIFMISLFLLATAPSSGGHINPTITFTTMTTGLTSFPRGAIYLISQLVGAAMAGGLIRGSLGEALTIKEHGGGCYRNSIYSSSGQTFLIEATSSFVLTFLVFALGLDPRQSKSFGPITGSFLTSATFGLLSFATTGLSPHSTGASMNPARCFAFAVARGSFQDQWIWWCGPLAGCLLQTAVYHIAPPWHEYIKKERLEEEAGEEMRGPPI